MKTDTHLKPILTDSSTFETFRTKGAVYVDKTEQLYRLMTNGSSDNYVVSRPRRFGKSLMISTLEAIFKGRRELFKGLAIDSLEYDWEEYPVLRFDFSKLCVDTVELFYADFCSSVRRSLEAAGATYDPLQTPWSNFEGAIQYLAKKAQKKVVVLIDEYDAPVGHSLDQIEIAEAIRSKLSSFYIQIKGNNGLIRFMLMTGVSKFTQLSVFSALNNLTDLTLRPESADLLGYSDADLETYFGAHMREHAERMGLSYEAYREGLQKWSDGYRFSPDTDIRMYNPYSIANTLVMKKKYFAPTWSSTGRPSFLTKYVNRKAFLNLNVEKIDRVTSVVFDVTNLRALRPETLLYQAGYLTIKDVDGVFLTLGIPNQEVRQDVNTMLLEIEAMGDRTQERDSIHHALSHHDFEYFETAVKAFYAGLTYGPYEKEIRQSEYAYARIFKALLVSAGFELRPEDQQSVGRSDMVALGAEGTYVFEFKVDKSAAEAMAQIKSKDYAAPYRARGVPIFALGLNFASDTARLEGFTWEKLG